MSESWQLIGVGTALIPSALWSGNKSSKVVANPEAFLHIRASHELPEFSIPVTNIGSPQPHKAINEEPNYASIHVARTQLHDNAAAIFLPAGGGCHGHLALTMTDVEYFAVTNIAFTVPINPTGDPVMVRSSRLESSENLRKHEEAKKAFKLYHDIDKALRKQLITATPEVYLQDLRDPILGYANITCLAIITHLRDTYGEISQEELDMNTTRMGAAWNPPTPIEDLFEQLRAGAAFAAEGGDVPFKPAMVRLGYEFKRE
eukprot:scaffold2972_cov48-Attheya_sp.AAC.1